MTLENVSVRRKADPKQVPLITKPLLDIPAPEVVPRQSQPKASSSEPEEGVTIEDNGSNRSFVKKMTISDIKGVLETLSLGQYAACFEENSVDGEILSSLSVDDLVSELNLKKLEALRLHKYVECGHVPK